MTKLAFPLMLWSLWAGAAQAALDVTCINGKCLSEGWEVNNPNGFGTNPIYCINGDCQFTGWMDGQSETDSYCHPNGCFRQGWDDYDHVTGRKLALTQCFDGPIGTDCLSYGWVTVQANGLRVRSQCINNDCTRWGWQLYSSNGVYQEVRCKAGGCFREGWTLIQ